MSEVNPTDATTDADREELTWELFGEATRELATADRRRGRRARHRGGGRARRADRRPAPSAYALGVKNCGAINVEFYTGVDKRLDVPVCSRPASTWST